MFPIVKIYFLIFGLISIAGGVMGYLKGSNASIIAGGITGVLLIAASLMMPVYWKPALILGLIVSVALEGRFLPALLKGNLNPAAYMAPLAMIGVVLSILALVKANPTGSQ
jgi:uncharacterized membrane protein (UPF0136 family)